MKAIHNSDKEHTVIKYESYYPTGQNRESGQKAWLVITKYRNIDKQNQSSLKVSEKMIEDLRYMIPRKLNWVIILTNVRKIIKDITYWVVEFISTEH